MAKGFDKRKRQDEVRERIRGLLKERQLDTKEVSVELGKNATYLWNFLNRGNPQELRESDRLRLEELFDLADGELAITAKAPKPRKSKSAPERHTTVPEIDVRGGLGGGGAAEAIVVTDHNGHSTWADTVKETWGLPSSYLSSELHAAHAAVRIIEVVGDSMSGVLESGDRVIVDTSDRRPSPPGLFAIWDGVGVVCKAIELIHKSDPPKLRVISTNKRYSPYEVDLEEAVILGRLVGRITRL